MLSVFSNLLWSQVPRTGDGHTQTGNAHTQTGSGHTQTESGHTQTERGHTLRRAESFFGVHFDFHATADDKEIGKTFTPGMIDSFLTIVKPDFVQVDCKGHPGYSSYPTRVGNQAGGYTKDILKVWREVTARRHVALYVHYSGIIDGKAMSDHPEWARVQPDGKPDKERAAYFGAYSDKILIPQLKEVADYGVDGAWIDGDCWATYPDYSPALLDSFRQQLPPVSSLSSSNHKIIIPRSSADSGYHELLEFNRIAFRKYMRKYVDAIHAYDPAFQITSNWSFSSMMPDSVDVNVDYLSGDVASQNPVYSSAFQARCMAPQGKPWDLMSWGFSYNFDLSLAGPKSLTQLEQEAAEVMTMGGGYQVYYTQNRDGSLKAWRFPLIGALGKFCRDRQPFCKDATTIPQIALWYSTYSMHMQSDRVYGWTPVALEGNLSMLLDGQHDVEILEDHHLKKRMKDYPLIVLPEWTGVDSSLKAQVLQYVRDGGSLLVTGASAVKAFEGALGVRFSGERTSRQCYIGLDSQMSVIKTSVQPVTPNSGTASIGGIYATDDLRYPSGDPAATVASYGKGKIAAVYLDMGNAYYTYQATGYTRLMNKVIQALFPHPRVTVSGSDYIHTGLSQKKGKWFIHLINTAGSHFNSKVYEYDHIPATGELTLRIDAPLPVKRAVLQPEGRELKVQNINGTINVSVPSVAVHAIVELDFENK